MTEGSTIIKENNIYIWLKEAAHNSGVPPLLAYLYLFWINMQKSPKFAQLLCYSDVNNRIHEKNTRYSRILNWG